MTKCTHCGSACEPTKNRWHVCKPCRTKYHARWRKTHPGANLRHRQNHWARKYGLAWNQVEELFNKQKGLCPIGNHKMILGGRSYAAACVDHCHKTGKLRGLLCREHNLGLGNFDDSPEALEEAARYLRDQV